MNKYRLIILTIALCISTLSFSQEFDTLFNFINANRTNAIKIWDFQALQGSAYMILYENNKELFVHDSRTPSVDFKLNARTESKNGDKYVESKSYQVKDPRFYNDGNLVIAASDFDHDGLGGRFFRWDINSRTQLEPIITGQWGIGISAIDATGNLFVNYYFEKPGNKIPVINIKEGKSMSVKRKQILYADNIYFTDNNEHLIFNSVLRNGKFVNIAFDAKTLEEVDISKISLYHKEKTGRFVETSDLKFGITIIKEGILITNNFDGDEQILKGTNPIYISLNTTENKLYLIVRQYNSVSLLQFNGLQRIFDEL